METSVEWAGEMEGDGTSVSMATKERLDDDAELCDQREGLDG